MTINIWLLETSQPIAHYNIKNAYTKGGLYCVQSGDLVYKYPLMNIFRIAETYDVQGK